jgi:hypothetical protein
MATPPRPPRYSPTAEGTAGQPLSPDACIAKAEEALQAARVADSQGVVHCVSTVGTVLILASSLSHAPCLCNFRAGCMSRLAYIDTPSNITGVLLYLQSRSDLANEQLIPTTNLEAIAHNTGDHVQALSLARHSARLYLTMEAVELAMRLQEMVESGPALR